MFSKMRSRKRRLWSWLIQILVAVTLLGEAMALPEVIKVGGLFETTDEQQELAFRYAIDGVNSNSGILKKSKLSAQVKKVAPHDSFRGFKTACEFFEEGVAAILGPPSPSIIGVLQSSCDTFQVPLIQTHWDYKTQSRSHAINLFPHPSVLARAYLDVLTKNHWKSFTLIYEENEALIRLQELLKSPTIHHVRVTLRHIKPEQDFKKLMKDLKMIKENNFVLDLSLSNIRKLFLDAEKVQMMTEYQNYMLTTLDVHTEEWDSVLGATTNVTALRLVDPENSSVNRVIRDWIFSEKRVGRIVSSKQPLLTEAALIFDAVTLVAKALEDLDEGQKIQLSSLYCDGSAKWQYGGTIVKYMKMIHIRGLSGDIKFDMDGQRTSFNVDIVRLTRNGIKKMGTWDPEHHVMYALSESEDARDIQAILKSKTLIVTTIITAPYMVLKTTETDLKGNDRFEGFCKDILDKISAKHKFQYEIRIVKDRAHGNNKDGEWNGMIGELLRREADLAIGDLTITYVREEAVDFTMPFMNLGVSILFKKQEKKNPPLFSFLQPLSLEVWFYMATAFLGVSLFLFLLARLSPYEWVNPHPCDPENDEVENQFNLLNSFWFAIGSIMQQGSDLLPRAISTRIVASSWWFFTLIMISSYTANLAAFLTAQRMTAPINNAADLAKQTKIQYGCVRGGSTMNFFKESNYSVYNRMWSYMETQRPTVFTESNTEGIERVLKGNYAFLMESRSIEYMIENDCDLTKIGGELDTKGYGIATPPGSPYRNLLSSAVLELQEKGDLHLLKEKWWKQKSKKCPDDSGSTSAEMGIRHVGGVFLVLFIGTSLGCIVVLIEFTWKAKKKMERDPIPVMIWKELRLIVSCRGSTRSIPKGDDETSADRYRMIPLKKSDAEAEGESHS